MVTMRYEMHARLKATTPGAGQELAAATAAVEEAVGGAVGKMTYDSLEQAPSWVCVFRHTEQDVVDAACRRLIACAAVAAVWVSYVMEESGDVERGIYDPFSRQHRAEHRAVPAGEGQGDGDPEA